MTPILNNHTLFSKNKKQETHHKGFPLLAAS